MDSKRLNGSVVVAEGVATVRRLDDPDLTDSHPGAAHLLHLAKETHDRVLAATRISAWVTPVLVLWAVLPQGEVQDRCAYVHGDRIADWLRAKPQTIAQQRLRQVADAVRPRGSSGHAASREVETGVNGWAASEHDARRLQG